MADRAAPARARHNREKRAASGRPALRRQLTNSETSSLAAARSSTAARTVLGLHGLGCWPWGFRKRRTGCRPRRASRGRCRPSWPPRWNGSNDWQCRHHRSRGHLRKRKGGETIDKWASPRTRSAESCRLSPGRGGAYGFQAKENGSQAHKIGLGARHGGALC